MPEVPHLDEDWKVNSDPRLTDVTINEMRGSLYKVVQRQATAMGRPGLMVFVQSSSTKGGKC